MTMNKEQMRALSAEIKSAAETIWAAANEIETGAKAEGVDLSTLIALRSANEAAEAVAAAAARYRAIIGEVARRLA